MAAKTTKDVMAWFKVNVAGLTIELSGHSDTHVAIYVKLLLLYWSSANKLPEINQHLHRKLGIKDAAGEVALADILNEFFPLDDDGNYYHVELDRQLNETIANSRKQSERASKPRGGNSLSNPTNFEQRKEVDEDNF
ncbi:DUF1376 domain-containing protein [Methylotenera sp. 1P/1]|uniref:DUF1376 domain-containing protein n=1 Tax=Methylotenera sp. 1P/1 TaxID=1131551 RepID=UPI000377B77D|nr:DUF1376 domain-containing protein [Methylotenera sp. 1P/1]